MAHSTRYEPILYPPGETIDDGEIDEGFPRDIEAGEREPLVSNGSLSPPPVRRTFGSFFNSSSTSNTTHNDSESLLLTATGVTHTPRTPMSSDGVFANIPAKPSQSRDHNEEDNELGDDEWIFMTPEQRKKLPPPKYSKIKRDTAPRYTTEYIPPALPAKLPRQRALKPRINSLRAGPSAHFIVTSIICSLLPFLGFSLVYLMGRGRWTSHAARLGSKMGLGMGVFHTGAMMFYIPTLLPGVFAKSPIPLVLFLLWTVFIGLPFGWRLSRDASREYLWLKTEERVLLGRIARENLVIASSNVDDENHEDGESGYRYIEGTDIRVRDLRKILARARDARLARSLRSAGF